jgi:hypothetical protein
MAGRKDKRKTLELDYLLVGNIPLGKRYFIPFENLVNARYLIFWHGLIAAD